MTITIKLTTYVDLHFPVQSVVKKEIVGHTYPVGLHGVALPIVIVSDVTFT